MASIADVYVIVLPGNARPRLPCRGHRRPTRPHPCPVPRRTIMLTVNEFRRLFDTLLLGTTEPWSTCCTGQPCVDTPGIRRSVGNYRPGTDSMSRVLVGRALRGRKCEGRCAAVELGDVLPLERAGQHVVVDAPPRGSSWPAPWVTARINRRCEEILFRQQWAGQISVPIVQAQQPMR